MTTAERITISEAAEILGVSPFTVGALVRDRKIPHYRIGRRVFLSRDEVGRWFEAHYVPVAHGALLEESRA